MDMAIQERENDLVLGTHGRGVYIIDDYSAQRNMGDDAFDDRFALLSVTPGQKYVGQISAGPRFIGATGFLGENPPYGAMFTVMASGDDLPHPDAAMERARQIAARSAEPDEDAEAPTHDGQAKVVITDADGNAVRSYMTPLHQGVNRIVWGLGSDGAKPRRGQGPPNGLLPGGGPEVPPGTYQFTISFDGNEVSGEVEVLSEPGVDMSAADYQARYDFTKALNALQGEVNVAQDRIVDAQNALDTLETVVTAAKAANDAEADDADADAIGEGEETTDPYQELLDAIGTARERLTEAEREFTDAPGVQGYYSDPDLVTAFVGNAGFYIYTNEGAPSANEQQALALAEARLERAVGVINTAIEETVNPLAAQAAALDMAAMHVVEPIGDDE